MQISGGASGYGVSFSDAFSSSSSSNISMTIDARNPILSISAIPSGSGYFKDQSIENTPNLMAISSVAYGVRVLANLTVSFQSAKEADDFKASASEFGVSANAVFSYVSSHSSSTSAINVYVVDGSSGSHVTLDANNFQSGINKILNSVTYQNAHPIEYQFMDMAGDIVGAQSATDDFDVRQCTPSTSNAKIKDIRVAFMTGAGGKKGDTNLNIYLYPRDFINPPNADDAGGAVYGYQSMGHSTGFPDNQESSIVMTTSGICLPNHATPFFSNTPCDEVPMKTRSWLNEGARLRIHIYPNGENHWKVNSLNLIVSFDDGTSVTIQPKDSSGNPITFAVNEGSNIEDLWIQPGSLYQ
jgi:hypothetical protein